jgi:hypothetical protein
MSATPEQVAAIMALVAQGYPLSKIPAGQPPPGEVSNLENPTTRGHMITTCNIICLVIVCTVVAMRMWTRIRIVKSLWWDDCEFLSSLGLIGLLLLSAYLHRLQGAHYSPLLAGLARQDFSKRQCHGERAHMSMIFPWLTSTLTCYADGSWPQSCTA